MRRSSLGLTFLGLLMLAGCRDRAARPEPLRIAAASDLRLALPVLISAFRQTRDIEVDFSAGSSGQLAEQIRQGAPFDLFLSANRDFVGRLATDGAVVPDSVRPYTRGSLALAINPVFGHRPRALADLADPQIKSIAIANTELAPYGIAAKQALIKAGLWDAVRPRLVVAESVAQAIQFVRSGNAEVGFASRATGDAPGLEFVPVSIDAYDPIVQYLGVVRRSSRQADARAFADFLQGPTGQGILADLGYLAVATPAVAPRPEAPEAH